MANKGINVGGSNLSNIGSQVKSIDTYKHYQKCLVQLTSIVAEEINEASKELTKQFLVRHNYFRLVWSTLNSDNREKIIQIITSSKEIIPYGKIVSTHSLDNAPENKFFFEKKQILQ